jgi:hypothetical protein
VHSHVHLLAETFSDEQREVVFRDAVHVRVKLEEHSDVLFEGMPLGLFDCTGHYTYGAPSAAKKGRAGSVSVRHCLLTEAAASRAAGLPSDAVLVTGYNPGFDPQAGGSIAPAGEGSAGGGTAGLGLPVRARLNIEGGSAQVRSVYTHLEWDWEGAAVTMGYRAPRAEDAGYDAALHGNISDGGSRHPLPSTWPRPSSHIALSTISAGNWLERPILPAAFQLMVPPPAPPTTAAGPASVATPETTAPDSDAAGEAGEVDEESRESDKLPILWMASNCQNSRARMVQALAAALPEQARGTLYSLGTCLPTLADLSVDTTALAEPGGRLGSDSRSEAHPAATPAKAAKAAKPAKPAKPAKLFWPDMFPGCMAIGQAEERRVREYDGGSEGGSTGGGEGTPSRKKPTDPDPRGRGRRTREVAESLCLLSRFKLYLAIENAPDPGSVPFRARHHASLRCPHCAAIVIVALCGGHSATLYRRGRPCVSTAAHMHTRQQRVSGKLTPNACPRGRRYVTEKLWQPLLAGAVPVYWGAPDAKLLLPAPDAAVHVRDFARDADGGDIDFAALAAYLTELVSNATALERHTRWRSLPEVRVRRARALRL